MIYVDKFDELMNREKNGSKKWNREYIAKRFGRVPEKIYPMFIADMDYKIDRNIHEAVLEEFAEGDFGYFDLLPSYFESIVNWYRNEKNIIIKKEWIVPSVGTVSSLFFAASSCCEKSGFLVMTPAYGVFSTIANTYGELVTFPLDKKDNRYYIDFTKLKKIFNQGKIKTLIFCNPHNPSGRIWSYEELTTLVTICKEYDITILSDEIHGEFCTRTDGYHSLIEFSSEYNKIIVGNSPNKAFNLSGLCQSYILTENEEYRKALNEEYDNYHITPNRMGAKYLEMSYREGSPWLHDLIPYIKENISCALDLFEGHDLEVYYPESSYLIWLKLSKVKNSDKFVKKLATETGVLLETGNRFIADYEQHIRINIATSKENVLEAMTKFLDFYDNYEEC